MNYKFFSRLAILLIGCISIIFVPLANAQSLPASEFLQASGRNLVYRGQTVLLQGANIHNIEALCSRYGSPGSWGSCSPNDIRISEVDYQRMSQEGGNHMRFGMAYRWYQDNPTAMFQVLDQHVQWAKKHNIWITFVIFTLPGDCYEGFVMQSCPFWNDSTMKNNMKQFWVAMANRYKNEPAVGGYDLLNEPLPPNGEFSIWKNYAQELTDAIRAVDTNHLIFFSSLADPYFHSWLTGNNIVYQVHDYSPMAMSHSKSPVAYPGVVSEWCGNVLFSRKTMLGQSDTFNGTTYPATYCNSKAERLNINAANNKNVPYYIGEWGPQVVGPFSGAANYIKDHAEVYRHYQVSHAFYSWKHSKDNWSIFPNQKDSNASSMTPWYPEVLTAVKTSWAGAVKPNFGGGGVIIPTSGPSPTSNPSSVPTNKPSNTTAPTTTTKPGDANGDGKIDGLDYVIWLNNYNKTANGVSNGDFNTSGKVDGIDYIIWLTNFNTTNNSSYPKTLPVTNTNIQIIEEQAPTGGKVYLKANLASSINVLNVLWYVDGGWKAQDNAAPWQFGNGSGFTLSSGSHEIRAVACPDTTCTNWVDSKTTYIMP